MKLKKIVEGKKRWRSRIDQSFCCKVAIAVLPTFLCHLLQQDRHIGIALYPVFVVCCHHENGLTCGSSFQMLWWISSQVGSYRCNMGTLICWRGQRSHIKVKGHLRSSFKIGWKCESSHVGRQHQWSGDWEVFCRWFSHLLFCCKQGTWYKSSTLLLVPLKQFNVKSGMNVIYKSDFKIWW